MNVKTSLLALALGVALSGSAAAVSLTATEAEDLMLRSGFTEISRPVYRDDAWIARARNADGDIVDVRVANDREVTWTRDGGKRTVVTTTTTTTREPTRIALNERPVVIEEVVEPPVVRTPIMVEKRVLVPVGGRLSKDDVRTVLAANGYHDIHDIDWLKHRGVWKAEARDRSGDDWEIHVDPVDGSILHVEDD
jgi:hypothetical protein